MKKVLITLTCVILAAVIGGGLWYYFYTNSGDYRLKHTDDWEYRTGSTFTVRLPRGMEPVKVLNVDNTFQSLGDFGNSAVVFSAYSANLSEQQSKALAKYGLMEVMSMSTRTINGKEVVPQERGSYVYSAYARTASGFFSDTNELWVIEALFTDNSKLYEVHLVCPDDKHSEYKDYMFQILDSFRIS